MYNPHNKKYFFPLNISNKTGVYSLEINSKLYIGSTKTSFQNRWTTWICQLGSNYKSAPDLVKQELYTKLNYCPIKKEDYHNLIYKTINFSVLEVVEDFSMLKSREQYWMDTLKPTFNQNNAVQPEYYYTLKSEEEKAYNYKISAQKYKQKRIQANRKTYIETYIVPITSVLDTLDPKSYNKGKWHLTYKGQVFKFPKLSTFVKNHNLNRRVLESIAKNRFDYKLPLSLKKY